ncbi:unnamed protein product [Fraxinus pennsylvanica]|uniref:Uncharacterized protein n=1 Tax=Fraxinus pennsylvanica TaxID=56036 RepID=A0AAD1ZKR0_9LAMI|nr:unnamed protein product [Fraxinus pennsylvanica]
MEAAPIKSQPLHNFSLPQLKWAHKNSTSQHHRFRRRDSPDNRHPDPDSCSESRPVKTRAEQPPTISKSPPQNRVVCADEEDNWGGKPWHLRPRKEVKAAAAKRETTVENSRINSTTSAVKSNRLRGWAEGGQQNEGLDPRRDPKTFRNNSMVYFRDCIWWGLQLTHTGFMMLSSRLKKVDEARFLILRGGFNSGMEAGRIWCGAG